VLHIENDLVSITLPDAWVDHSDADGLAFANGETHEELVISFGTLKHLVNATKLAEVVWRLVEHKAAAIGQMSGGTFRVLDVSQPPPAVPYKAMFSGFDSKNSTYSRVTVAASAEHLVSISYYLHGAPSATPAIVSRAIEVMAMCRAKVVT
jgi:hypothetical protein